MSGEEGGVLEPPPLPEGGGFDPRYVKKSNPAQSAGNFLGLEKHQKK